MAGRADSRRWLAAGSLALSAALGACTSHPPKRAVHHSSPPPASAQSQHANLTAPSYVVRAGDTLYSIAFRNQIDYHDLANWNDIGRDYAIHPGQTLRLVPPGSAFTLSPGAGASTNLGGGAVPAAGSTKPRGVVIDTGVPAASAATAAAPPVAAPLATMPGAWRWPLLGPLVRGYAPNEGAKGIDIGAPIGQAVTASAAGKVVYSGAALKGYGELIIIKHSEDYLSAYGYNSRRLVEEGTQVDAGQAIAEVGAAPGQKPALHFEIRYKGTPVDPLKLLPAAAH